VETRTVAAAAYSAEIVSMGLLEPLGTAENVLLFEHDTEHTSGIRTQNAKLQSYRKGDETLMSNILSPSQKAANALRRAEKSLQNWQDDPDSPHNDVDKMLAIVHDLRNWVQGHVIADIESAHEPPSSHKA